MIWTTCVFGVDITLGVVGLSFVEAWMEFGRDGFRQYTKSRIRSYYLHVHTLLRIIVNQSTQQVVCKEMSKIALLS
jgi:hypothetical protein